MTGPTHDQHPPFTWNYFLPHHRPNFMPIETFHFHPFNLAWTMNTLNTSENDFVPEYARINETAWQIRPRILSKSSKYFSRILDAVIMIFNFIIAVK